MIVENLGLCCHLPITCSCIPCGHVYGRSCLEKWLGTCGNTSAKCPQCGAGFEQKHIINIYTPGDLFDGCSRMQEVEAHYSKITEFRAGFIELLEQHASENKFETSKVAEFAKAEASLEAMVQNLDHMSRSVLEMKFRQYMELAMLVSQNLDELEEGDPK